MMIGVPVKPIRAQFGSALRRFACRRAGVRAVRLVDEDDDCVALVEEPERLLLV